MITPNSCILLLLFLSSTVFAQQELQLRGQVVRLDRHGRLVGPVRNTKVTILETGNADVTNNSGAFRIPLPSAFRTGDEVEFEIDYKDHAVLPYNKKARIPSEITKEILKITLVPIGSPLLLSPDALVALIRSFATQPKRVEPTARTDEGEGKTFDLRQFLTEWAQKNGFGIEQVQDSVSDWIAGIEQSSKDFEQLGLAALAKKEFGRAGEYFRKSAERHRDNFEALKEKEEQEQRKTVDSYILEGNAYYDGYEFDTALVAYENALRFAPREKNPTAWAQCQNRIGNALVNVAIRTSGEKIHKSLGRAISAYRLALEVRTRSALPQDWAATQNNLAIALWSLASRSSGAESQQYLKEAISSYRAALEVRTRSALPQDWAATQNNLAGALWSLASQSSGAESQQYLKEAISSYRAALEVRTRSALPQDWAMTQSNLAIALNELASRSSGAESQQYLKEAISSCRAALEVYTHDALPRDWAATQSILAAALSNVALRISGAESQQYLKDAISSYRAALKVYTPSASPQQWAATQNNLATALSNVALRISGAESQQYLKEAISSCRVALEVSTRSTLPQIWAATQKNLGTALVLAGSFSEAGNCFANVLLEYPLDNETYVAVKVVEVAQEIAQNRNAEASKSLEQLRNRIASVDSSFRFERAMVGVSSFVDQSEVPHSFRALLKDFFGALEEPNRDAIVAGLQRFNEKLQR